MARSSYDGKVLRMARSGAVAELVAGSNGLRFWVMNLRNVDTPVDRLIADGSMTIVRYKGRAFACASEYAATLRQELKNIRR